MKKLITSERTARFLQEELVAPAPETCAPKVTSLSCVFSVFIKHIPVEKSINTVQNKQ